MYSQKKREPTSKADKSLTPAIRRPPKEGGGRCGRPRERTEPRNLSVLGF